MQLSELTTKQLAEKYNSAAVRLGRPVLKKFSDKKVAIRRTTDILADLSNDPPIVPKVKAKKKPDRRGVNFLGMRQDIKASPSEARVSLKREDSIRAEAFKLLVKGATFAELEAIFVAHDERRGISGKKMIRRMYEMVRIFCYYYGWGTKSSDDGTVITLVQLGDE
jgi:hypothetical protein